MTYYRSWVSNSFYIIFQVILEKTEQVHYFVWEQFVAGVCKYIFLL